MILIATGRCFKKRNYVRIAKALVKKRSSWTKPWLLSRPSPKSDSVNHLFHR